MAGMNIRHVAKLAHLPLTEEELAKYGPQLEKIVEYVDTLQKADTQNVAETNQVTNLHNVDRPDGIRSSPLRLSGFIKTKAIFSDD